MRKTDTVNIDSPGRDLNKVFVLTEMPASIGKRWIARLWPLLAQLSLPKEVDEQGSPRPLTDEQTRAAIVAITNLLDDPSLSDWRDCVQFQMPGQMPQKIFWDQAACQIEETATITLLQWRVFDLHTGFFSAAKRSTSG